MDVEGLARGLVSGWLIDQVSARGRLVQYTASAAGLVGVLLVAFGDTLWRGIGGAMAVVALFVVGTILFVRWVVTRLILRFALPASMSGHRERIDQALTDADLPTTPLAIARFLYRLRRGARAEVDRLRTVVGRLVAEISET